MPRHSVRVHDNLSRFFFIVGVIASTLFYLVPAPFSIIFRYISIGSNYGGYLFWFTSANVSKAQERPGKWYAFAHIKNQHRLTAILGAIATTLMLMSIFFPVLLPIAFWLFTVSNLVWMITTYHQKTHPPRHDPNYTPESAENYFNYVVLNTCASIITALAATLIFCFPASAVLIFLLGFTINAFITIGSLIFLVESATNTPLYMPPTIPTSHDVMHLNFGASFNKIVTPENSSDERHPVYKNIFLDNVIQHTEETTNNVSRDDMLIEYN